MQNQNPEKVVLFSTPLVFLSLTGTSVKAGVDMGGGTGVERVEGAAGAGGEAATGPPHHPRSTTGAHHTYDKGKAEIRFLLHFGFSTTNILRGCRGEYLS